MSLLLDDSSLARAGSDGWFGERQVLAQEGSLERLAGPSAVLSSTARAVELPHLPKLGKVRADPNFIEVIGAMRRINMELDKAFEFAVILAWDDLTKATKLCSARVEYQGEPGAGLDHLSVWSARVRGYHDLVCDYWTRASSAHPSGLRFRNGQYSDQLAQTLDFIMKNQDQFTRSADACRNNLVVIDPPAGDERTEAATWMKEVRGSATNFASAAD
jgi:hypothetical protein